MLILVCFSASSLDRCGELEVDFIILIKRFLASFMVARFVKELYIACRITMGYSGLCY